MQILIIASLLFFSSCSSKSWRDASRESYGIAEKAEDLKEDIFQIYYARAYSWRGFFAIHPWVAWKKVEDAEYTVAQVSAWNLRRNGKSTVSVVNDLPDRLWFDHPPRIHFEKRGQVARTIIDQIEKHISNYPFQDSYTAWPGPNSNTFVAYLIREIDELDTELPAHAIGKDYLGATSLFAKSPAGKGFQFSLLGLLGLTMGLDAGIEINLLGLNFGVDFWKPAFKLPLVGRVGFEESSE